MDFPEEDTLCKQAAGAATDLSSPPGVQRQTAGSGGLPCRVPEGPQRTRGLSCSVPGGQEDWREYQIAGPPRRPLSSLALEWLDQVHALIHPAKICGNPGQR